MPRPSCGPAFAFFLWIAARMAFSDFRSRLFLITPPVTSDAWDDGFLQTFEAALSGTRVDGNENHDGDVGCVLIDGSTSDERTFMDRAEPLVKVAQAKNVAGLIMGDSRIAGRLDADGVHVADPKALDQDEQNKLQDRGLILGCGGINTRHLALNTGEREFDYLFFGRTDREPTPDNHPKTVTLSLWWAQMMSLPCVALCGTSDEAFAQLAEGGIEFIAMREQIWQATDPAAEVIRLNTKLDEIAQTRMAQAAAKKAKG